MFFHEKYSGRVHFIKSLTPVLFSTVRLCSDRLSLIKDCLAQMSTNYKQSAKLLGLANLLRVAGKLLTRH